MTRELIPAIVLVFSMLVISYQAKDLCKEHPLSNKSALCQEYLKLTKEGSLENCTDLESTLSCQNYCNSKNERNKKLRCYCDAKCSSLGDCCVDYSLWCNNTNQHTTEVTCRPSQADDLEGHVVHIGCPVSWHDEVTKDLCFGSNNSEPLTRIPVYDYETSVTFNNVYCALCNNVSNFRYWQIKFEFQVSSDLKKAKNMSITRLLNTYKNWRTEPASAKLQEHCIPGVKIIPVTVFNQVNHNKKLWSFCKAYSMKVIGEDKRKFKNPHCGLLISNPSAIYDCTLNAGFHITPPPSTYTLIFTFKPKGTPVLSGSRDRRVQEYSCQPDKVYDPFENLCRKVIISSTRLSNRSGIMLNNTWCTRVSYNSSEYFLYPNGSLLILSQQKIYTNGSYSRKGDNVLLCTNFTANYTRIVYNSGARLQTSSVSNILGRVGSAISITALLCLLLTRLMFRELRTLYGKNIMSLAFSLVIFHIAFLIPTQTESTPTVCDVISGVRHYSFLAMFAWMNVIAYDVSRTFTMAGLASGESDRDEEQRHFRIFSLYAWGMPLVVVTVCVIMDATKAADMGYGSGDQSAYCFLSPTGRIYCSAMPIGVVLLFNIVAFIRTVIAIRRVQNGTSGTPVHNPYPSMSVLCLKLTSVMGLTWLMGFVYAIENNLYLEYVHIVLNSLQGFFVFISFGCNRQILSLFKNKFS